MLAKWDISEGALREPPTTVFGRLLRGYRRRARRSQSDLARAADIRPAHVCRLESGERAASPALVDAFARTLALTDYQADLLRLAAGYAPRFAQRRDVRRLARKGEA